MLREGTTPNGIFGVKVMATYVVEDVLGRLRRLPDRASLPAPALLTSVFPNLHYVHMRRRDRVRQAVSWVRAHQTGIWSQRRDTTDSTQWAERYFALKTKRSPRGG
ncbi:MAG: hypothetical protein JOZ41_02370 [Chloroflexi bacterium]|nr:hypothetical protein [Chloroflexota bacterium]